MEFTKEKRQSTHFSSPIELPDDDDYADDNQPFNETRLWIGNIDVSVAEFVLLKLCQHHGELEKFDYAYTKDGPNTGKPRGFCFVTYKSAAAAQEAIARLNGYKVKDRHLVVRLANSKPSQKSKDTGAMKKESQIAAIEAKLKRMEKEGASSIKDKLRASVAPSPLMKLNVKPSSSSKDDNRLKDKTVVHGQQRTKPY